MLNDCQGNPLYRSRISDTEGDFDQMQRTAKVRSALYVKLIPKQRLYKDALLLED